jgi:hypothetical protein
MLRARACFLACKFGGTPKNANSVESQRRSRQLFSEVLVAEDVDLGSRIHALGYKSVFLDEVLARGEVCSCSLLHCCRPHPYSCPMAMRMNMCVSLLCNGSTMKLPLHAVQIVWYVLSVHRRWLLQRCLTVGARTGAPCAPRLLEATVPLG